MKKIVLLFCFLLSLVTLGSAQTSYEIKNPKKYLKATGGHREARLFGKTSYRIDLKNTAKKAMYYSIVVKIVYKKNGKEIDSRFVQLYSCSAYPGVTESCFTEIKEPKSFDGWHIEIISAESDEFSLN